MGAWDPFEKLLALAALLLAASVWTNSWWSAGNSGGHVGVGVRDTEICMELLGNSQCMSMSHRQVANQFDQLGAQLGGFGREAVGFTGLWVLAGDVLFVGGIGTALGLLYLLYLRRQDDDYRRWVVPAATACGALVVIGIYFLVRAPDFTSQGGGPPPKLGFSSALLFVGAAIALVSLSRERRHQASAIDDAIASPAPASPASLPPAAGDGARQVSYPAPLTAAPPCPRCDFEMYWAAHKGVYMCTACGESVAADSIA